MAFTHNDYEVLQRETLAEGFLRLVRYHFRQRQYAGGFSEAFTREVLEGRPAAAVLLYDPALDKVVLIEQFRPGALANPQSPWLVEIVAGLYDPDESPSAVAMRESEEEAGCKILDIYPICEYFVSPGQSNEHISLFCGKVNASHAGGVHGLPEENEDIMTLVLPFEDAYRMIRECKIKTAPAIISLQWLKLNREWLRDEWQAK
jgi:ADP-ribose pyrophosphatase